MLAAWGGLSAAWFSFNVTVGNDRNLSILLPISNSGHHYQDIKQYIPWTDNTKAGNAVETIYVDTLSATPIFNIIWQKAFLGYNTSFCNHVSYTEIRRKKKLNLLTLNAANASSQCSCYLLDQFPRAIRRLRDTCCLCCISSRCSCSSHSANCNPKMIGSIFVTCHLDDAICFIFAIIHLPMYTAIPVSA